MAKPQTFSKKENEKKKQARRLEKQNRKEEKKLSGKANSFDDMIAYPHPNKANRKFGKDVWNI